LVLLQLSWEKGFKDQDIIYSYLFSKLFHLNPGILEPLDPFPIDQPFGI